MSSDSYYTHKVAANAYIYHQDKFLLLKRNNEPRIWAPPGGCLNIDEDPEHGLQREVKEETNLEVEILVPANTWFGVWRNTQYLLSIDYLARITGGQIELSNEHSEFAWTSPEELRRGKPVRLDPEIGFQIKDFENAKNLADVLGLNF